LITTIFVHGRGYGGYVGLFLAMPQGVGFFCSFSDIMVYQIIDAPSMITAAAAVFRESPKVGFFLFFCFIGSSI
jgi:hypothetical protein